MEVREETWEREGRKGREGGWDVRMEPILSYKTLLVFLFRTHAKSDDTVCV